MQDRYDLVKIEKLEWRFGIVLESYSIHPYGFYDELMVFLNEILEEQSQIDYYVDDYPIVFKDIKEIKKYFKNTLISAQEKTWIESLLNTNFGLSDPYQIIENVIQWLDKDQVKTLKKTYPLVFYKYLSNDKEYHDYK